MAPGMYGGTLSVELHSEAAGKYKAYPLSEPLLFGAFLSVLACAATARALPTMLHLFGDATSLGGVESLIDWRKKRGDDAISPLLLRISVGLEECADLKADLEAGILATRAMG
jgi:cystathionine beta-lyase/cystathionine gamma-synthase